MNKTIDIFIDENIIPNKNIQYIGLKDRNGNIIDKVDINDLSIQKNIGTEQPIYKFGLLSDIHIDTDDNTNWFTENYFTNVNSYRGNNNKKGEHDFKRAVNWLINEENVNMICSCGDITMRGIESYDYAKNVIDKCITENENVPFYTCSGNHDTTSSSGNMRNFIDKFLYSWEKMHNLITDFEMKTSDEKTESFSYTFSVNKGNVSDRFIFLNTIRAQDNTSPFKSNDMEWLESKLNLYINDRVFVFMHYPFPNMAGDALSTNQTLKYPHGMFTVDKNNGKLYDIYQKYKNVIWFTGHTHWKWQMQRLDKSSNITPKSDDGGYIVHIPSCSIPIDVIEVVNGKVNTDEVETINNNCIHARMKCQTQGSFVEVYEDYVVIKGVDFNIDAAKNPDKYGNVNSELLENEDILTTTMYTKILPLACYKLQTKH